MAMIIKSRAAVFFCLLAIGKFAYSDEKTLERFFNEAPRAWQQVVSEYETTEFKCVERYVQRKLGSDGFIMKQFERNSDINQLGNLFREDADLKLSQPDQEKLRQDTVPPLSESRKLAASVANDKYVAHVSLDSTPVINGFERSSFGSNFRDRRRFEQRRWPSLRFGDFSVFDLLLAEKFENHEFKGLRIIDASEQMGEIADEKLVRVDFAPSVMPSTIQKKFPYSVFLDPGRFWVVVRFELVYPEGSMTATYEYPKSTLKPHPSKLTVKEHFSSPVESEAETIISYSTLSSSKLSQADYSLAAFGILEPTSMKFSYLRGAFVLAILALAVALLSYIRRRRFN